MHIHTQITENTHDIQIHAYIYRYANKQIQSFTIHLYTQTNIYRYCIILTHSHTNIHNYSDKNLHKHSYILKHTDNQTNLLTFTNSHIH